MITNAIWQIVAIRPEITDMHRAIRCGQVANGTDEATRGAHFGRCHRHDSIGALLPITQKRWQNLESVRQRIHSVGEVVELRLPFVVSRANHTDTWRGERVIVAHLLLEWRICFLQRFHCVDNRLQVHAIITIGDLSIIQSLQHIDKLRNRILNNVVDGSRHPLNGRDVGTNERHLRRRVPQSSMGDILCLLGFMGDLRKYVPCIGERLSIS